MSSPSFESTIDLAPRPSTRAVIVLFWLHALPLAILMFSIPPGSPLVGIALGIGASWLWLRRHRVFGYGPRALVRLTWHASGGWTLHTASGGSFDGELLGSSVVLGELMLLNFRDDEGASSSRLLLGDELDEELLRPLKARLRTTAPA